MGPGFESPLGHHVRADFALLKSSRLLWRRLFFRLSFIALPSPNRTRCAGLRFGFLTVLSFCDFGDSKGSGSEWSAGGIALRRCRGQKKPMGNFCSRTISSKESAEEIVIAAKWSLQSRDLACPQAGESPKPCNLNGYWVFSMPIYNKSDRLPKYHFL